MPQPELNELRANSPEVQAEAFHEARNAETPRQSVASWAIAMGLGGLFLGYVGATDSYEYSLLIRLSFWLGLCLVAGVFALMIESALVRFNMRAGRPLFWWAILTSTLAVTMVPVIFLVNSTGSTPPVRDLPLFAANSFAISGALVGLRLLVGYLLVGRSARDSVAAQQLENEETGAPAIMGRLRPGLRSGQLLALKSEGHYVRVYTELGTDLVLMRLKDAISEAIPARGMQVHRSWWIARRSKLEQRTNGGRLELKLGVDTWAPVSRTYLAEWKAEQW